MTALVTENLSLVSGAPNGIAKLRELVLELAVRGKLVSQDASDESASLLLDQIAAEKRLLVKQAKPFGSVPAAEQRHALPHGWSWTRLGSLVLESGAGWSPSCEPRQREGDEWGVLKVSAVSWGAYQPEENKALPAHLDPRPEHEVQPGDFLVSRANTADLVARSVVVESTPPQLMLSDKIVRLKLARSCNRRFVNLANSCPDARRYYGAVAGGTSSSMKNVSREQILNLPVPVPPLAEQHRIVAKVDELMALCDRLEAEQADADAAHAKLVEALLASLTQARDPADFCASWQQLAEHFHTLFTTEASVDTLKQTVLQLGALGKLALHAREPDPRHASIAPIPAEHEPFSLPPAWRWVRLGSLCELVTSGSRGWKEFYADSGSTFIRSQDIKSDKLEFDNRAFVRLPPSAEGARTLVAKDDLLVTITGANVGKAAHLVEPVEDAYVSQHVALVRLRDPALSPFIHRWLTNPMGGRAMLLASSYGAKPGLNLQNIRDLPIPLPPVAEQREIVARIDEVCALCEQLKLHLSQARQHHKHLASVLVEQVVT